MVNMIDKTLSKAVHVFSDLFVAFFQRKFSDKALKTRVNNAVYSCRGIFDKNTLRLRLPVRTRFLKFFIVLKSPSNVINVRVSQKALDKIHHKQILFGRKV